MTDREQRAGGPTGTRDSDRTGTKGRRTDRVSDRAGTKGRRTDRDKGHRKGDDKGLEELKVQHQCRGSGRSTRTKPWQRARVAQEQYASYRKRDIERTETGQR